jgi:hypothetical protein
MLQAWLNFAGLCLDFAGVLLLANEWRIALQAEQMEADIQARENRLKPSPMMPPSGNPHQPVFDYMRDKQRFQQQMARGLSARGMRRSWFVTAMVLIAGGFLLQILGSMPGGYSLFAGG